MNLRLALPLALALGLLACDDAASDASDTTSSSSSSGSSTSASSSSGGVADWDECSEIAQEPTILAQTVGMGAAPTPAGMAIADGTYAMTKYEVFGATGLTSDEVGATFVLKGGAYQLRTASQSANGTFSAAGTTLTFNRTCDCNRVADKCGDDLVSGDTEYSATATELVIFSGYANGGTAVAHYTKQ